MALPHPKKISGYAIALKLQDIKNYTFYRYIFLNII